LIAERGHSKSTIRLAEFIESITPVSYTVPERFIRRGASEHQAGNGPKRPDPARAGKHEPSDVRRRTVFRYSLDSTADFPGEFA